MERTNKGLWLEIIRVRSAKDTEGTVKGVIETVRKDEAVGKIAEVRLFSNGVGDLAVHISWETARVAPEGSTVALRLAAALSEYGLTDHTIWTEEV